MTDVQYYQAVIDILSKITVPASHPDKMRMVADVVEETVRRGEASNPPEDPPA